MFQYKIFIQIDGFIQNICIHVTRLNPPLERVAFSVGHSSHTSTRPRFSHAADNFTFLLFESTVLTQFFFLNTSFKSNIIDSSVFLRHYLDTISSLSVLSGTDELCGCYRLFSNICPIFLTVVPPIQA